MKVIAINGSPRRNWNTASLLQESLWGAASIGAETKMIHLYGLKYNGCLSCFACKKLGGPSFGRCAIKDELKPLLDEINDEAAAIIIGSPIYYGSITGNMQSFLERLLFQYNDYSPEMRSLLNRKIPVGAIYTMGAPREHMEKLGYAYNWERLKTAFEQYFGPYQQILSTDTLQFADYSQYASSVFDVKHKHNVHDIQFPKDKVKAFDLGKSLAESVWPMK